MTPRLVLLSAALAAALSSCASTPSIRTEAAKPTDKLHLIGSGSLSTSGRMGSQSASFTLQALDTDSLRLEVRGPFGIFVGRLFSSPNYYCFLNGLEGEGYEGKPTAQNMENLLRIRLSHNDLATLTQCEVPGGREGLTFGGKPDSIAAVRTLPGGVREYVRVDDQQRVLEYRREEQGTVVLAVQYADYAAAGGRQQAMNVRIALPRDDARFHIAFSDVVFSPRPKQQYKFSLPPDVPVTITD